MYFEHTKLSQIISYSVYYLVPQYWSNRSYYCRRGTSEVSSEHMQSRLTYAESLLKMADSSTSKARFFEY